eukprot:COSAG05_NODE_946_length_6457_cov_4.475243_7_plen_42_part_00
MDSRQYHQGDLEETNVSLELRFVTLAGLVSQSEAVLDEQIY